MALGITHQGSHDIRNEVQGLDIKCMLIKNIYQAQASDLKVGLGSLNRIK